MSFCVQSEKDWYFFFVFFFSENTIFTLNHCLLWDLCAETLTSARNVEKLFQWQNIFDINFLLTPNVKTNHLQPTTKTANPSFHLKKSLSLTPG